MFSITQGAPARLEGSATLRIRNSESQQHPQLEPNITTTKGWESVAHGHRGHPAVCHVSQVFAAGPLGLGASVNLGFMAQA